MSFAAMPNRVDGSGKSKTRLVMGAEISAMSTKLPFSDYRCPPKILEGHQ